MSHFAFTNMHKVILIKILRTCCSRIRLSSRLHALISFCRKSWQNYPDSVSGGISNPLWGEWDSTDTDFKDPNILWQWSSSLPKGQTRWWASVKNFRGQPWIPLDWRQPIVKTYERGSSHICWVDEWPQSIFPSIVHNLQLFERLSCCRYEIIGSAQWTLLFQTKGK